MKKQIQKIFLALIVICSFTTTLKAAETTLPKVICEHKNKTPAGASEEMLEFLQLTLTLDLSKNNLVDDHKPSDNQASPLYYTKPDGQHYSYPVSYQSFFKSHKKYTSQVKKFASSVLKMPKKDLNFLFASYIAPEYNGSVYIFILKKHGEFTAKIYAGTYTSYSSDPLDMICKEVSSTK